MKKIEKYNQKVLAILGTMAVIGLGSLLIVGAIGLIGSLVTYLTAKPRVDNAITISPKDSTNHVIRDQEITFRMPQLVDTLNSIYLIPVSQVNLEQPEEVSYAPPKFGFSGSRSKLNVERLRYSGDYNNIVVYDQKKERQSIVFDRKANISNFEYVSIEGRDYIFIRASCSDSDKNNKLNRQDLASFFVYNIASNQLKEFSFPQSGLIDFYITEHPYDIVLQFAKDKDGDGNINGSHEPRYLKRVSLKDEQVYDLITKENIQRIQRLID